MAKEQVAQGDSGMQRGDPDATEARKKLVKCLQKEVREAAKKYNDGPFKRMREDMNFAFYGASESWYKADKYIANFVQSHIRQKVSSLYAKNPRAIAVPAKKEHFTIWDGKADTVITTIESLMTNPLDPNAMALLEDVQNGKLKEDQVKKLGKTLEISYQYYQNEQVPHFKGQMKQMVRRAITAGVGYVEVGFQRATGPSSITERKLGDYKDRLDSIQQLSADQKDGKLTDMDDEVEKLQLMIEGLKSEPEIILREGPVFDFPRSTQIIPSLRCTQLSGFVGADWVAKEMLLTVDEVKKFYSIDITGNFTSYKENGLASTDNRTNGVVSRDGTNNSGNMVRVWIRYDKQAGLVYHMADGYTDFLEPPAPPRLKFEQFYPWFSLVLNEVESDKEIFPPSDVRLLRHQQIEINRTRDELIKHRKANRPKYATPVGALETEDKRKLANHESNAVLSLRGLKPGQSVRDILQQIETAGIDPNLYETGQIFEDILRVVGSQEANLGGTAGGTATESSIAESSRLSSIESNVDDLDDMLTNIARETGNIMLRELSPETVIRIAGDGAFWPQLSLEELMAEVSLQIEAGSSGKPNKSLELANLERIMPFLIQIPGITPEWMAKELIRRLDDRINIEDAILDGLPSIIAMNAQTQVGTGDPATDPSQQGGQGARGQQPTGQGANPTSASASAPPVGATNVG